MLLMFQMLDGQAVPWLNSLNHVLHFPPVCLQNKGSLQFEDKWDLMRPIVLKLLRQESVTKQQWFDLFS